MGRIFKNYFLPETVCHCFLVETGTKLVLVDTGLGREDMRDPSRLGMMAPLLGLQKNDGANSAYEQVRKLGYTPEDVTDIIVTHMDVDHAGGIPDFKWANVHVHERELEAARARNTFVTKQRYSSLHVLKDSKWEPFTTGPAKWKGFDRAQELVGLGPDFLAVSLPGHTIGHSGIAIKQGEGWLLHAGDAYYNRREISADDRIPLGVELMKTVVHTDLVTTKKTQVRLRELVEDSTIRMVCSHDPVEFRAFTTAT